MKSEMYLTQDPEGSGTPSGHSHLGSFPATRVEAMADVHGGVVLFVRGPGGGKREEYFGIDLTKEDATAFGHMILAAAGSLPPSAREHASRIRKVRKTLEKSGEPHEDLTDVEALALHARLKGKKKAKKEAKLKSRTKRKRERR